jgi:hypothetical protein
MRMLQIGVAACAAALAGCGSEPARLPDPIPTDGPNQVVVFVPGMT